MDAADLFQGFYEVGLTEAKNLLEIVSAPEKRRKPRTWNITEASQLIGRSLPWLREHDPDCDTDDQGRRKYTLSRINELREAVGHQFRRPDGTVARTIAVMNFKGGVGKSTISIHLAHKAAIDGLKVLVLDLDPQASTTSNLANILPDVEIDEFDILNNYLIGDPSTVSEIIRPTYFENVDIIPTNLYLQDMDLQLPNPNLSRDDEFGPAAYRLRKVIEAVESDYDLIVLDCPPNMAAVSTNALLAANGLLIPLPPEGMDCASFTLLSRSLSNLFSSASSKVDYVKLLVSRHDSSVGANMQERRIRELYSPHVLSSPIYDSKEISKAALEMCSVYHLERPINSRKTFQRAMDFLDAALGEILEDQYAAWGIRK